MAEFEKFQYDFVFRTRQIVQDIPADYCYDVTLLLNCLLGLMAYPIEVENIKETIKHKEDPNFDNVKKFTSSCVKKARDLGTGIKTERDDVKFFTALRDAIAHGYITPHPSDSKASKITLEDRPYRNPHSDFEITFTIPALKELALYIADQYLTIWPLDSGIPPTVKEIAPRSASIPKYSRCCWRCRSRSCWKGGALPF